jgi:hypothetical protein
LDRHPNVTCHDLHGDAFYYPTIQRSIVKRVLEQQTDVYHLSEACEWDLQFDRQDEH